MTKVSDLNVKTDNTIGKIYRIDTESKVLVPIYDSPIAAGFPNYAANYFDRIDFAERYVKHPLSSYLVKVSGNSMMGIGIFDGDDLLIDTSVDPMPNQVVIAAIEGELTVKRLKLIDGKYVLRAENPDYCDIIINDEDNLKIWGVAVFCFKDLCSKKYMHL